MQTQVLESPPMVELNVTKMRTMREAAEMTQVQAAQKAKMSGQRWHDIEAGGRTNITLETLGAIADALGCSASDLLTESKPRRKASRQA